MLQINNVNTLRDLLHYSLGQYPENKVSGFARKQMLRYKEFGSLVYKAGMMLQKDNIRKGDKVIILSENNPSWGIAHFAITNLGAIAVPILPDFTKGEIENIFKHSGAKAVFYSKKLSANIPFDKLPANIIKYDIELLDLIQEITDDASITDPFAAPLAENDLATIIYTSGTTGTSKGVMLTHKNLVFQAKKLSTIQPLVPGDRFLSVLPLAHTYEFSIGLLFPILNGASIYYLEKPPTASVLLPILNDVKPTLMLTVPLIIEKIFKLRIQPRLTKTPVIKSLYKNPFFRKRLHAMAGKKLKTLFGGELKFFGIGGAPLAPEVEKFLRDAKFPYAIGYGLTETSPLLAGAHPSATRYRSTGPAMEGVELKIINPDPMTGEGEIVARGENIMAGYYKDENQTQNVFTEDGFFKTGDLGVFDQDGNLYIKGRLKNMILGPSGENIYPEEIEAVLNSFETVSESLVYELKGKLIARVHLNYEELESKYNNLKDNAIQLREAMNDRANQHLQEIQEKVNAEVNKFSRLQMIVEQVEPFEKTPTQKIKRYLYL